MAKKKEIKMNSIESAIADISTVEVKKYLPIDIKIAIVDEIVAGAGAIEDGIYIVNNFVADIFMRIKFIVNYTNIDLEGVDVTKTYDMICESKFLEALFAANETLEEEYEFIEDMVYSKFEQEDIKNNSVAAILTKGLNLLASKIPDETEIEKILETVKSEVGNLDMDKIEFIKSAVNALKH
jgi:hypothetical protein